MKKVKNDKKFMKIFSYAEVSLIVFVVYSLISLVFPFQNFLGNTIATILGILIMIFVFGYLGHSLVKDKKKLAGRYGAYLGIVIGVFSAILGILSYYLYPSRIFEALEVARDQGADMAVVEAFMEIGLYFNLLILPAIYAGIGALITWLSYLILKKLK